MKAPTGSPAAPHPSRSASPELLLELEVGPCPGAQEARSFGSFINMLRTPAHQSLFSLILAVLTEKT